MRFISDPGGTYLSKNTQSGKISQKEDMGLIQNLWRPWYQILLERLKEGILSGPTVGIPYPSPRFYIKMDWYKDVMGAVLM